MNARKQSADATTLSVVTQKHFWMEIRRALLIVVVLIERACNVRPTTSELRQEYKDRSRT